MASTKISDDEVLRLMGESSGQIPDLPKQPTVKNRVSDNDILKLIGDSTGPETPNPFVELPDPVRTRLPESVRNAVGNDPDKAAESRKLSTDLNIPREIIDQDPDRARNEKTIREHDPDKLVAESPKTAEWISDPSNAEVAWDDINILRNIEQNVTRREDDRWWWEGFGSSMLAGLAKGYEGVKASYTGEQTSITDLLMERSTNAKVLQGLAKVKNRQRLSTEKNIEFIKDADELIGELTPQNMSILGEGARGAAQFVSELAIPMIATVLSKGKINATVPLLTTKVAAESYATALAEGKSHNESLGYGFEQSIIEYLTERGPTKLLERMGVDLKAPGFKKKIGRWFAQEFAGEQVATAGQTFSSYMHDLDEEIAKAETWQDIVEIQAHRQAVTGIATILGGGAISGGLGLTNHMLTRVDRQTNKALKNAFNNLESSEAQDMLEDFISLAQGSATGSRAPDQFRSFLEKVDPDASVFLNAEVAAELDDMPDYVTAQLDGTGADISIPMRDFMTDFALNEELLTQVRAHIKIREDLKSQSELEESKDDNSVRKLIEKAQKDADVKTEIDMIYEQVKDQLVGTRRQGEHTARLSAELIPAYIATKHAELKKRGIDVTVKELFDEMVLRVVGPGAKVEVDGKTVKLDQDFPGFDSTTTDMPYYDDLINKPHLRDYFRDNKGVEYQQITMTPDEYLAAVDDSFEHGVMSGINESKVEKYAQKMKDGEKFPALTLDYAKGKSVSQEGRHRALAAKRAGINSAPVIVVTPTQQEAEHLGIEVPELSFLKSAPSTLSQSEQSEWDAAVAKGLDMSEPARMQRAKDMGHEIELPLYHLTKADITEFIPGGPTNIDNQGAVYLTPDPSKQIASHNVLFEEEGANQVKVFAKMENPLYIDEFNHKEMIERYNLGSEAPYILSKEVVDRLKSEGYDSVVVEYDALDRDSTEISEIAILYPENIRSVNAAFDPDHADSTNILAQQSAPSKGQDFGDLIVETVEVDEAGNAAKMTELAQDIWDDTQDRLDAIEEIRACLTN